jgi:hypothetical protein
MKGFKFFSIGQCIIAITLLGIFLMGVASPVYAAEIINNEDIQAGETIDDDVLLSGQNPVVDGTVNGLLLAAGETVTINGTIHGDVIAFGQTVTVSEGAQIDGNLFTGASMVYVNGKIDGSVFGGSSAMTVEGKTQVGRNLFYGGYSLKTEPGSKVNRDLFVGGYQALLDGEIGRDLKAGAGAVELDGKVGRDAVLEVGDSSNTNEPTFVPFMNQPGMPASVRPGIRVAKTASIGGTLKYTAKQNQSSAIEVKPEGGVVFQTPVPTESEQVQARKVEAVPSILRTLLDVFRNIVTLLILGALALWLIPALFKRTVFQAQNKPLPSAGVGFLAVIVGYGGAVLAALVIILLGIFIAVITLGGLSQAIFGVGMTGLALIVAVFTLLVTYGSKLIVSYLVGELLVMRVAPNASHPQIWALITGVVIYALLAAIPILGWLISLAVTLIGLGAMWYAFRSGRTAAPVEPAAPETPAVA